MTGRSSIVENGVAKRLPVTIGLTAATGDVEINKGLIGGEDLILAPPKILKMATQSRCGNPKVKPK